VRVVWDPVKALINYRKHGVTFVDAEEVFNDPLAVSIEDSRFSEQRFIGIGCDSRHCILVIIYSYPGEQDEVRLISARHATPTERELYFGKNP
jgi:uncharacterized DUF497 family protein